MSCLAWGYFWPLTPSYTQHGALRVGGCTEEVLEWFNSPPCKVSCQGISNWSAWSLWLCFARGQPNGWESCKKLCCQMLWWLKAHQNDCSCACELSSSTFDSLSKNLAWWAVTRRTSKKKKHRNIRIGEWALSFNNTVLAINCCACGVKTVFNRQCSSSDKHWS